MVGADFVVADLERGEGMREDVLITLVILGMKSQV